MHSVTKHFYKGGWHGVNIEPLRSKFELLQRERPRDTNLNVAVGDAPGSMCFFECMEENDLSTLDPVIADQFRASSGTVTKYIVPVVTLNEIFERYCGSGDFRQIDIEDGKSLPLEAATGVDWPRLVIRPQARHPAGKLDDLESIAMWHD
jgi:hypothetical protein